VEREESLANTEPSSDKWLRDETTFLLAITSPKQSWRDSTRLSPPPESFGPQFTLDPPFNSKPGLTTASSKHSA